MQFPFVVKKDLTLAETDNFKKRFGISNGHDCSIRENIWRRHQTEENKEVSGWSNVNDQRRRLIHFRDKYGIIGNNFCLIETYLYVNMFLPKNEIEEYLPTLKKISNSVLELDGNNLNLTISNLDHIDEEIKNKPWKVFSTGIRKRIPKGQPTYINKEQLKHFFPAHVELGCGPSIEAGIPPLNYFHNLFSLSHNGKFVFDFENDNFIRRLLNLENWYEKTTKMQLACLQAPVTKFYKGIKKLIEDKKVIEPIFNNNFDGLVKSLDVQELCLRQFDKTGVYPEYDFSKEAKSLIVIGSHADRRYCQASARKKGLKILFIDPEGYYKDNEFVSYPLESPQSEDFILKLTANDIFE